MNSFDERSISPVVGTLLMIVIIVLLSGTVVVLSTGIGDTLTTQATAGVTIDSDDNRVEITVTTAGNADYVNISGDVYDHLDSNEYNRDDLRQIDDEHVIRLTVNDLEQEGWDGRVVAIAVRGDTETVVTTDEYTLEP